MSMRESNPKSPAVLLGTRAVRYGVEGGIPLRRRADGRGGGSHRALERAVRVASVAAARHRAKIRQRLDREDVALLDAQVDKNEIWPVDGAALVEGRQHGVSVGEERAPLEAQALDHAD